MKSRFRLAIFAGLFPAAVLGGDASHLDIYRELIRFRTEHLGAEQAFEFNTNQALSQLVDDPTAFYSELSDSPSITNEIWWAQFVDNLPVERVTASTRALEALKWHTGLSKARPGLDVIVGAPAIMAYGGREAAANALKARVDADIFRQAGDMNGTTKTVAAGYAVALQILREQMKAVDPKDYERYAIKADVFARYMAQTRPDRITEEDERYLATVLRYELSVHGGANATNARDSLPAAYRVARVAAAYADRRGYFGSTPLCSADEPAPGRAMRPVDMPYGGPLCFIAATDRAVQSWYRKELRNEESALRKRGYRESSPTMHLIGTALLLVDFVSFVEVVEAVVADDLATTAVIEDSEAEVAAERSRRLTCRINR